MAAKLMLSVLLACGLSMSAGAAEDPANSKLLKQCESAKGQVKRECEDVAKKMLTEEPKERDDQTSQEVTHSSPAMATPAEAKKDQSAAKKEEAAKKEKPPSN
ncbi:MAG TPA: hypothetical protein VIU34_21715 [Steroidobacter sp.]